MTFWLRSRSRLAFGLLLASVLLTVLTSRVRDVASDPIATLVTSQMLVKHGTLALDSLGPERVRKYGGVLAERDGHHVTRFPLGTSLLSLPVVAVATLGGMDLSRYENERLLQVLLVALLSLANVTLLVRLARLWLPPAWALALGGLTWFGSSFASTQATALWSHDFATVLALVAIFASVRSVREKTPVPAVWIGAALFLAYLCRPTLSALAPALIGHLYYHDRRGGLRAALVLASGLALFVVASLFVFGQALPDYYRPARLGGSAYGTALLGNLVSPARGLFVFSPLFLFPLLFFRETGRALARDKAIALVAVLWPVAHLLLVSRLRHWWAGYSFGPRFLTDIVPGLFVLLCLSVGESLKGERQRWVVSSLVVLGGFSVFVNTAQGLYSRAPKRWNAEPSIDEHPELVFDWRYPQFLHTEARHRARLLELGLTSKPDPGR